MSVDLPINGLPINDLPITAIDGKSATELPREVRVPDEPTAWIPSWLALERGANRRVALRYPGPKPPRGLRDLLLTGSFMRFDVRRNPGPPTRATSTSVMVGNLEGFHGTSLSTCSIPRKSRERIGKTETSAPSGTSLAGTPAAHRKRARLGFGACAGRPVLGVIGGTAVTLLARGSTIWTLIVARGDNVRAVRRCARAVVVAGWRGGALQGEASGRFARSASGEGGGPYGIRVVVRPHRTPCLTGVFCRHGTHAPRETRTSVPRSITFDLAIGAPAAEARRVQSLDLGCVGACR
jgi:hypothetical protein